MTRKSVGGSVAIIALVAAFGSAVSAQDAQPTAPAQTPAQTPAPTPAERMAELPQVIRDLGLTDIESKPSRHGTRIEGDLPGGGELEALLNPAGKPVMVEVDDAELPAALRDAILPQSVRGNAILSQFATIEKIGTRDGFVMIGGEDAGGKDLRAGFDPDGQLMRFGRDDDDRPRGPREMHRRGDGSRHMEGGHHDGRAGWKGHGDDDGRGSRHGFHGGDGQHEGRPAERGGMMRPAPIDQAAVSKTLETAGYSQIEAPRPAGPRLLLDAVNPSGEKVMIEVDPAGEVVRELAR
jgi:hypothetical protein